MTARAAIANRQVSPLAASILRYIKSNDISQHVARERETYDEFARQGYKPVTVYLAMCELYQAGYINGIVSH